ncbi:hypothetical protein [Chamaesiphon sp. GL140_3_metabinner_50]|uniref:hypothetical protein n=1 Tax=Chamaesiphon sp. GL140_3_metabinner_50 TaxID=2970812 RepID=UPI0025F44D2E|nr:hypothetical protein [Chamaesiphon sp. GL140_3_metabinner_50]
MNQFDGLMFQQCWGRVGEAYRNDNRHTPVGVRYTSIVTNIMGKIGYDRDEIECLNQIIPFSLVNICLNL